jgi:NTP pyrophosphatase (non-canonical NTP hydrolase)
VTRSNLNLVPKEWIRKQTVANGERFVTEELKEVESKILGADEKAKALEVQLFGQLREEVLEELNALQSTAGVRGNVGCHRFACGDREVVRDMRDQSCMKVWHWNLWRGVIPYWTRHSWKKSLSQTMFS